MQSMKYFFKCPKCLKDIGAEKRWIGFEAVCPYCFADVIVPPLKPAAGADTPPQAVSFSIRMGFAAAAGLALASMFSAKSAGLGLGGCMLAALAAVAMALLAVELLRRRSAKAAKSRRTSADIDREKTENPVRIMEVIPQGKAEVCRRCSGKDAADHGGPQPDPDGRPSKQYESVIITRLKDNPNVESQLDNIISALESELEDIMERKAELEKMSSSADGSTASSKSGIALSISELRGQEAETSRKLGDIRAKRTELSFVRDYNKFLAASEDPNAEEEALMKLWLELAAKYSIPGSVPPGTPLRWHGGKPCPRNQG